VQLREISLQKDFESMRGMVSTDRRREEERGEKEEREREEERRGRGVTHLQELLEVVRCVSPKI
jgi:hypothetical protein